MPSGKYAKMLLHTLMLMFLVPNKMRKTATAFDGFTIYREDDGSYIGQATAKARSFHLTGLIPGESHNYWVTSWREISTKTTSGIDESKVSIAVKLTA